MQPLEHHNGQPHHPGREAAIYTGTIALGAQTRRRTLVQHRFIPVPYSRPRADLVLSRIRAGFVLSTTVAEPDMPCISSIMRWFRDNIDNFAERYKHAQEDRLMRWAEEIIEIADDVSKDYESRFTETGQEYRVFNMGAVHRANVRIKSRQWMLAHLLPERFGDKSMSISVNNQTNVGFPAITINPVSSPRA